MWGTDEELIPVVIITRWLQIYSWKYSIKTEKLAGEVICQKHVDNVKFKLRNLLLKLELLNRFSTVEDTAETGEEQERSWRGVIDYRRNEANSTNLYWETEENVLELRDKNSLDWIS